MQTRNHEKQPDGSRPAHQNHALRHFMARSTNSVQEKLHTRPGLHIWRHFAGARKGPESPQHKSVSRVTRHKTHCSPGSTDPKHKDAPTVVNQGSGITFVTRRTIPQPHPSRRTERPRGVTPMWVGVVLDSSRPSASPAPRDRHPVARFGRQRRAFPPAPLHTGRFSDRIPALVPTKESHA